MRHFQFSFPKRLTSLLSYSLLLLGHGIAADPPQVQSQPEAAAFFESRIRPIFIFECYDCHGSEKQSGGLRLDHREGLLKGGEKGPSINPGDAQNSLLIQAVSHALPDLIMPSKRPKLPKEAIEDLITWINSGAFDPRDEPPSNQPSGVSGTRSDWATVFESRKDWWSFKPVQPPVTPIAGNDLHPIDYWIHKGIEEKQLTASPPADRRSLVRRLHFTLVGLPPTLEEIETFLSDARPDAVSRLVDRLLNSPRFGERWARHWMDLMRFAETHGSEGDPEIPFAWRYRDYLIRAFNEDVPLDELIREHIAGDLLPNPRINTANEINESITGPAHLRLVEHGFQPVDALDEQVRTLENQIDVVSKAFQGLTIACARCHDHKFDPISQQDYHGLYSIFASVRPSLITIDTPERLRVHREELTELKDQIQAQLASTWTEAARQLGENLEAAAEEEWILPGDSVRAATDELRNRLAAIDRLALEQARYNRFGMSQSIPAPEPLISWSFNEGPQSNLKSLNGELIGGAKIEGGKLVLNGEKAYFKSAPLPVTVSEKTLEAWVSLSNLDQRGGGVMTIEADEGAVFDGIVYAEEDARKWISGSDFFRRTRPVKGVREDQTSMVHLAFVYHANGKIALFRNGELYGEPYRPEGEGADLRNFAASGSHILLGLRHTGGGNAFLKGEIDEARLYVTALSAAQVKQSYEHGPNQISPDELEAALKADQLKERDQLRADLAKLEHVFAVEFLDYPRLDAERQKLRSLLAEASKDPKHPLHPWTLRSPKERSQVADTSEEEPIAGKRHQPHWHLGTSDADSWFSHGINPPEITTRRGAFAIEPKGDSIITRLLPSGIFSHLLSQKHNGVLTSPRFEINTDFISVRAMGGNGARVRVIVDNYPLGGGNIFPQATLNSANPTWVRIDTAYRKGASAYLEFAPATEVTSRERQSVEVERSFFGLEQVVFHNGDVAEDMVSPEDALPAAGSVANEITKAIQAWREGSLSERQLSWLNLLISYELLPTSLDAFPQVEPLLARYRSLESQIPIPRRAPGVLETVGFDSPLLTRGDHRQPQNTVPRRYLDLVGSRPYPTNLSGRLELASEIANSTNPLTGRVMANRIWSRLFGQGLVATVDNFGRLGEKPTHPELLDELAYRFTTPKGDGGFGWSVKSLIRFITASETYQRTSQPEASAEKLDPTNQWLSHMNIRRLDAEPLRDSLLFIGQRLDLTPFGSGDHALAPPTEQTRRSIFLTVRRNELSPFLQVFDAPKPFTTLGQRDATNVPAQSLTLLNDPFVVEMAQGWIASILASDPSPEEALERMFEQSLGRKPSSVEVAASCQYLHDLQELHGEEHPLRPWQDLALSLFNLKEFLYLP